MENNEYINPDPDQDTNASLPEAEEPQDFPITESVPDAEPAAKKTADQEEETSSGYRGAGAGYRESPYASSPYESAYTGHTSSANWQPQQERPNYTQPGYTMNYQPKPVKPRSSAPQRPIWRTVIAGALTVALVAGGCLLTAMSVNKRWEQQNKQQIEQMNQKIQDLQTQIEKSSQKASESSPTAGSPVSSIGGLTPGQVYAQNVDSVVAVSCTISSTNFYGQTSQGTSTGSGFIITEDGYVVSNYHVVDSASAIKIITHSGEEYTAKLVGSDSTNDVAVLKVETEGLPAAKLGSSDDLIIGDMVVAIGNPLGELTATQTVGYVSGKNREVTTDNTIISMIQTDAAINAGNSGGPLFNMKGEVVGITTAKYSGTTSSGASIEGIGFAIPIDDVMSTIGDLKEFGYITGAYLGITVQNTDAASASLYGLPTGAYVVTVVNGSCAEKAGLQPKDIIIGLGDFEVSNVTQLTRALRKFKAGDETTLRIIRSGQEQLLTVVLDEKPRDLNTPAAPDASNMPKEGSYDEWYDYFYRFFSEGGKNDRG